MWLILNNSPNEFGFSPFRPISAYMSLQKWLPIFSATVVAKNKNGVIRMEIKMKDKVVGKGISGMMKSVGAAYQRIAKIWVRASEAEVSGFAAYEISREYQAYRAEVESARAQAVSESHRVQSRC